MLAHYFTKLNMPFSVHISINSYSFMAMYKSHHNYINLSVLQQYLNLPQTYMLKACYTNETKQNACPFHVEKHVLNRPFMIRVVCEAMFTQHQTKTVILDDLHRPLYRLGGSHHVVFSMDSWCKILAKWKVIRLQISSLN